MQRVQVRDVLSVVEVEDGDDAHGDAGDGADVVERVDQFDGGVVATSPLAVGQHRCREWLRLAELTLS